MQGDRIIDFAADVGRGQPIAQGIAPGDADDVLIVDVQVDFTPFSRHRTAIDLRRGDYLRFGDHAAGGKKPIIAGGVFSAAAVPPFEIGQFHPQGRGLDGIKAKIAADHAVIIFRMCPMVAEQDHLFGKSLVTGDNHPAIANSTEIFAGKKGKTAGQPHSPGPMVGDAAGKGRRELGANRLGGVFDDRQPIPAGQFENIGHIGTLAVEMNGNDCLDGPLPIRFKRFGKPCRINIERGRLDIGKNRQRTKTENHPHGGKKRVGGGQHPITWADPQGHQGDKQGIGAAGHPDPVGGATVCGDFLFKGLDLRALNIAGRSDYPGYRFEKIVFEIGQLRLKIKQRYFHGIVSGVGEKEGKTDLALHRTAGGEPGNPQIRRRN